MRYATVESASTTFAPPRLTSRTAATFRCDVFVVDIGQGPIVAFRFPLRQFVFMTRVLVIVGVRLYRDGLTRLLGSQDGLHVVGAAADGRAAADALATLNPDVALIDMNIEDAEPFLDAVHRHPLRVPLVALGLSDSEDDLLACAERGAAGFVTAEASLEELTVAILHAAKGELLCSPRLAGTLLRRVGALATGRKPDAPIPLTRREREVAALMREDLSNKEIASRLRIEVATVKNHVHNVFDKLRVHRRQDAARLLSRRQV